MWGQPLEVRVHGKSIEEDRMSILVREEVHCPSHSSVIKRFVWFKFQVAPKMDLTRCLAHTHHYKVLDLPKQHCGFNMI